MTIGATLGNMVGYSAGSFLYEIGNFILPFYVNSAGILITIPLLFKYFPTNNQINEFVNS